VSELAGLDATAQAALVRSGDLRVDSEVPELGDDADAEPARLDADLLGPRP
jgi:hypothetical protein